MSSLKRGRKLPPRSSRPLNLKEDIEDGEFSYSDDESFKDVRISRRTSPSRSTPVRSTMTRRSTTSQEDSIKCESRTRKRGANTSFVTSPSCSPNTSPDKIDRRTKEYKSSLKDKAYKIVAGTSKDMRSKRSIVNYAMSSSDSEEEMIASSSTEVVTRVRRRKKVATVLSSGSSNEDSSDESERFNPDMIEKAKDLVKTVYQPILDEYNSQMGKYLKDRVVKEVVDMNISRKYKTYDGTTPDKVCLESEKLSKGVEVCRTFTEDGSSNFPVPIHYVPSCKSLPRMRHWVHVEQNIKMDDNLRLSHIPYVDDDHDSASFCAELKKAYPEGIHGTKHGWRMYISDHLMFKLLKAVVPLWQKSNSCLNHLYKAIYKLFPNKLTPRELEYACQSFEERFSPKVKVLESTSTAGTEDVQHSIKTMFCIKCMQFHCLLHGLDAENYRMHRKPRPKHDDNESCGSSCYLHLTNTSEGSGVVRKKSRQDIVQYTGPTLSLFQRMIHNNRHSPCQLTVMMMTIEPSIKRTCQEIHQLICQTPRLARERSPEDIMIRKISVKEQQSSFRNFTWSTGRGQVDNSAQPIACKHDGPCGQTKDCYCAKSNTLCSKYCSCGPDCRMRFPGCRCQPGACRTKQCQCFFAKWECDPDVCHSCNCVPYMYKKDEERAEGDENGNDSTSCDRKDTGPVATCSNINIQRGNYKQLRVGVSNVAGYGCFIAENAERGDFIAEYTGEVISKWEAERRGRVYDEFKCSYIFALNTGQSVDATRLGNHIRFANHSDKHPNCYSQIIIVNGEHRIGVYAKRRIEAGEELFFDYQYDKKWKEKYVPVEINRSGAVTCEDVNKTSPSKRGRKKKISNISR